jgi:hypothetical protein
MTTIIFKTDLRLSEGSRLVTVASQCHFTVTFPKTYFEDGEIDFL